MPADTEKGRRTLNTDATPGAQYIADLLWNHNPESSEDFSSTKFCIVRKKSTLEQRRSGSLFPRRIPTSSRIHAYLDHDLLDQRRFATLELRHMCVVGKEDGELTRAEMKIDPGNQVV